MVRERYLVSWLVVGWLAAGCVESNPQPSPLGFDDEPGHLEPDVRSPAAEPGGDWDDHPVNPDQILASATSSDGVVLIAGLESAAPEAQQGYFERRNHESSSAIREAFYVRDDGSFLILLTDWEQPTLRLVFEYPESRYLSVLELPIPIHSSQDDQVPWLVDSSREYYEPSAGYPPEDAEYWDGAAPGPRVTVSYLEEQQKAQIAASVYVVTPLSQLVITNLTREETTLAQANNQGAFLVTVPAAQGNAIGIFALNPLDSTKATPPLVVVVP